MSGRESFKVRTRTQYNPFLDDHFVPNETEVQLVAKSQQKKVCARRISRNSQPRKLLFQPQAPSLIGESRLFSICLVPKAARTASEAKLVTGHGATKRSIAHTTEGLLTA